MSGFSDAMNSMAVEELQIIRKVLVKIYYEAIPESRRMAWEIFERQFRPSYETESAKATWAKQ
jgi:hypothetical protein